MPYKVPEYESRLELRPTDVDPREASLRGREIVDLSEGLSSVADTMQKVKDETQILRSKTELSKRLNDIHNRALTNPDIWNANKQAEDEMQKAISDTAKGVESSEARIKYTEQAQNEVNRRSVGINNTIFARQLKESKDAVTAYADSLMDTGLQLVDPAERKLNRQEIINTVQDAVRDGRINQQKATDYLRTNLKKLDHDQVLNDLSLDAQGTLRQLELGKDGQYSNLTQGERAYWYDKAKKAVQKEDLENKEIFAIAQNKNEEDILKKFWAGVSINDDIIKQHVAGGISESFAKAATEAMESPKAVRGHTDARVYMDLVDDMHKPGADPKALRERILKDVSAGTISNSIAEKLYTANYLVDDTGGKSNLANMLGKQGVADRQKILKDAEEEKKRSEDRRNIFEKIIDMFKQHTDNDSEKTSNLTQDLMNKVSEEKTKTEDLHAAARQVLSDDILKNHPEIANYPKEGKIRVDAQGNKARVYPDGTYDAL